MAIAKTPKIFNGDGCDGGGRAAVEKASGMSHRQPPPDPMRFPMRKAAIVQVNKRKAPIVQFQRLSLTSTFRSSYHNLPRALPAIPLPAPIDQPRHHLNTFPTPYLYPPHQPPTPHDPPPPPPPTCPPCRSSARGARRRLTAKPSVPPTRTARGSAVSRGRTRVPSR